MKRVGGERAAGWLCALLCAIGACGGESSGGSGGEGGGTSTEPAVCHNGIVEGDEACDSILHDPCNGCNDDCSAPGSGPICGDGHLCPGQEVCEDGNTFDGDYCSSSCKTPGFCQEDPSVTSVSAQTDVPEWADVVALCNLDVLVASKTDLAVLRFNVDVYGSDVTYPVGASPTSMALDGIRGLLYVGVASGPGLVRVSLVSGEVTPIPVNLPVLDVTVGDGEWVFASLDDPSVLPDRKVALVNGVKGVVEEVVTGGLGALLAYDHGGKQLLSADGGAAPGELRRHAFDPAAKTLTLTQEVSGVGSGCHDLTISPDAQHLALVCDGGNDGANNVLDYDPADLTHVKGQWAAMSSPLAVAFSPATDTVLVSSDGMVGTYGTTTHELVRSLSSGGCFQLGKLAIAPAGRMYYGLNQCMFGGSYSMKYDWLN